MKKRFSYEKLPEEEIKRLKELGRRCRGDIIKMTTVADSGHPGGSMSSIDIYLTVFSNANIDPKDPWNPSRDRIIVSHGHTSPGVYSVLGELGFFKIEDAIAGFRYYDSPFEGHITRGIPGVEWTTGNLGQGLSAACGMALAAKIKNLDYHVFALMSDAEQAKGQVAEARRFAKKFGLSNITVVIDYNDAQISGHARNVMFVDIKAGYESDGWRTIEVDGHDYVQIYDAIKYAIENQDKPTVVIARTIMGKGVSFMEDDVAYHGKALSLEEADKALKELGVENDIQKYLEKRKSFSMPHFEIKPYEVKVETGKVRLYKSDQSIANRDAFGHALADIAVENAKSNGTPIAVIDCDLKPSTKTDIFERVSPDLFFQAGVQEHNAATVAGALSSQGVVTFFADFGVFGIDETYNQQRLNDINHTNLKLVVTHVGTDVGEDGKTHHCVDYIGALRNIYNFKLIVPQDGNQTDRAVRFMAKAWGNYALAVGRSKIPVITKENGQIFFDENYKFVYGECDLFRKGENITIFSTGQTSHIAVKAADELSKEGIRVTVIGVPTPFELPEWIGEYISSKYVITFEDHNANTGLGSIIPQFAIEKGFYPKKFVKLGLFDYTRSGAVKDLYKIEGLDSESLKKKVREIIK
ncbi:MAG: transketolase [Mesoaciditoga sp.]|uniref:transketolase n=1 Tax=Athalassotoga sp. TaxID=2022597 RepID=UPI000CA79AF2|nr:MAG: transketolase [Mesoaciditoga sp.]PMP80304.1 MAG: transketolase [Mesoaciditoga sp.]HEU25035.1 transketolase [Mesoaciditoga lauensis]